MIILVKGHPDYKLNNRCSLPSHFYRPFHENSPTDTRYSADDHDLDDGVAFQALRTFSPNIDFDTRRDSLLQHLDWLDSSEPNSPFIPIYGSKDTATTRADHQYNHRYPPYRQERVSVAKIATSGLQPAGFWVKPFLVIPVWVDRSAFNQEVSTPWKVMQSSGLDMWISMGEICAVFNIPGAASQNDEWLACGSIPTRRVEQVMPFDGEKLREMQSGSKVVSHGWEFNWGKQMWVRQEEDACQTSVKLANKDTCVPMVST